MEVEFIFKIAAIGIIVAVLNTLLVRSGSGRAGDADNSCRSYCCVDDDNTSNRRTVFFSKVVV